MLRFYLPCIRCFGLCTQGTTVALVVYTEYNHMRLDSQKLRTYKVFIFYTHNWDLVHYRSYKEGVKLRVIINSIKLRKEIENILPNPFAVLKKQFMIKKKKCCITFLFVKIENTSQFKELCKIVCRILIFSLKLIKVLGFYYKWSKFKVVSASMVIYIFIRNIVFFFYLQKCQLCGILFIKLVYNFQKVFCQQLVDMLHGST